LCCHISLLLRSYETLFILSKLQLADQNAPILRLYSKHIPSFQGHFGVFNISLYKDKRYKLDLTSQVVATPRSRVVSPQTMLLANPKLRDFGSPKIIFVGPFRMLSSNMASPFRPSEGIFAGHHEWIHGVSWRCSRAHPLRTSEYHLIRLSLSAKSAAIQQCFSLTTN
jgi:hypothetical protein